MDTDELSNKAYTAVLVEAERFHHNLTIHFGVLADDCDNEVDNLSALPVTLDKILANIARVREIPEEKRTYEF